MHSGRVHQHPLSYPKLENLISPMPPAVSAISESVASAFCVPHKMTNASEKNTCQEHGRFKLLKRLLMSKPAMKRAGRKASKMDIAAGTLSKFLRTSLRSRNFLIAKILTILKMKPKTFNKCLALGQHKSEH